MIVTGDGELATRLKRLRDHGQSRKYYHEEVGFNSRMDGLQAAVLRAKLTHLDAWNENRREHAANYRRLLGGNPRIALPVELPGRKHIYHIYAVRVPRRDRVIEALNEEGIHCGIHYPQPIHLQNAYRDLGYLPGAFPVVEQLAAEELSLPMYAELRHEHQERVAEALAAALDRQPGE